MNKIRRCRGDPPDLSRSSMSAHTFSSQVRLHGVHKSTIEVARKRLLLGAGLFIVGFFVVSLRLIEVALFSDARNLSARNEAIKVDVGPARADIVDRNGVVLATSLTAQSLHANPQDIRNPVRAAARLVGVLPELNSKDVALQLKSDKRFVWLNMPTTAISSPSISSSSSPTRRASSTSSRVSKDGLAEMVSDANLTPQSLQDTTCGGFNTVFLRSVDCFDK